MRKFWMLAGVFVALFGGIDTNAAQAEDSVEVEQEQAVVHYEAIEIESAAHALKILDKGTAEIAEILKQDGELEFTDLESIHEITYTLEASVDKIRDEKAAEDAKIDLLDEAVQAIHFASENQKEAEVRSWFAKLETAAGEVKTKIVDITPVKREFYEIIIKDHKFSPVDTIVPAGEKIKLKVINQDATPEEFESHDMNREKIIRGNKTATIFVGPLKPGKYHFFGEFNMDTANGYIIAK